MISSIIKPIITPIIRTIINPDILDLSRYFSTLDPVLNSYYELASPITFTGDFEVEVEFATVAANGYMINGDTDLKYALRVISGNLWWLVGDGSSWQKQIDTTITVNDGLLHKATTVKEGSTLKILLDGVEVVNVTDGDSVTPDIMFIGSSHTPSNFFDGIIANPIFTDKSGAEDIVTEFTLGNATGDIEYSKGNTFGGEVIVNGDFATDSDWTLQGGSTISGDKLILNSTSGYAPLATQTVSFPSGQGFRLQFEVTNYSEGTINVRQGEAGSGNIIAVTSNGTYEAAFAGIAAGTLAFRSSSGNTVADIEVISVKEIQGNALTYINIPDSNREQYTLTDDGWLGHNELVAQPIDLASNWIDVAGGSNIGVNTWDTVSTGGVRTGDIGLTGLSLQLKYSVFADTSDILIKDSSTGQSADPNIASVTAGTTGEATINYTATLGGIYLRSPNITNGNTMNTMSVKRVIEVAP